MLTTCFFFRYNMTAGMTLTGPANSNLEDPPYKRHLQQQQQPSSPPPLAVAPPAPTSYKLPPDLELSKAEEGEGMEEDVEDISSASVHNHKNRQVITVITHFLDLPRLPLLILETDRESETIFYLLKIPVRNCI